jgi:dienelactone hydrolase
MSRRLLVPVLVVSCVACRRAPPSTTTTATTATTTTTTTAAATTTTTTVAAPELVTFPSGPLTLHGFLYRPSGSGPFPAVVFNHGSEKLPGDKRGQADFYVAHGFVLFVPHRRGQGRSQDQGRYVDDFFEQGAADSPAFVEELVRQTDDVMAAVAYVASLPDVDAKHVAVAGCSLGGIESLFAAERGTGIVAAVDFAGASMTWARSPTLRERMKTAARNAKVPVLFLQAENDFDTTPTRALAAEMSSAGKPARAHVYPPNGVTADDGHAFCSGGANPPWADEVLAFVREPMR